jgi:transposase, IS5 family
MSVRAAQLSFLDAAVARRGRRNGRLEAFAAALDWSSFERLLRSLRSDRGAPGYSPLTMFKVLLLQRMYNLSDPLMEERLGDTVSWLAFVGLGLEDDTPDHSTISRFRSALADNGLLDALFDELQRQLDAKGLILRQGTLIDASLIPSAAAPPPRGSGGKLSHVDPDASWGSYGGRGVFGYKMHVAVDRGTLLIRRVLLSGANRHDVQLAPDLVIGDEDAVFADKAYDNAAMRELLGASHIENRIMRRPNKHHPVLPRRERERNAAIASIRRSVESIFAWIKRAYAHARLRYFTAVRNRAQILLLSFIINTRRSIALKA